MWYRCNDMSRILEDHLLLLLKAFKGSFEKLERARRWWKEAEMGRSVGSDGGTAL